MELAQVVPWGRSLAEYRAMFALGDADLAQRILGCGDGPASFNAEMTACGHAVVSVDPIYAFSGEDIAARIEDTYATIIAQVEANRSAYCWHDFRDPAHLGEARMTAMGRFLADYDAGREAGRYRAQALPMLAFADDAFDLALCSHLLFLYSGQLDLAFHLESLRELTRVAREVRIFPLLALDGHPSPHLEPVCDAMRRAGHAVELVAVPYEFQRGGNQMLRIQPSASIDASLRPSDGVKANE